MNGDTVDEADETYGITLSNPGNATIADGSGLGTIADDDAAPSLSVNDVSVTEGNAGTTTATFTVTLSAASGRAVTFDWAAAAGSATAGTDFVAASGSKTVSAGSTTTTFTVTVNGDVLDEIDETFGITLSNPGNATVSDGSGLGTITDDDAAPTLSVDDVSALEGDAGTTTGDVHRHPLRSERQGGHVRLGHRRRLRDRGHGLRRRERQPDDRGRGHDRHGRHHRQRGPRGRARRDLRHRPVQPRERDDRRRLGPRHDHRRRRRSRPFR